MAKKSRYARLLNISSREPKKETLLREKALKPGIDLSPVTGKSGRVNKLSGA